MLFTPRLKIKPLSAEEVLIYQKDPAGLSKHLELNSSEFEFTESFVKVLEREVVPNLKRVDPSKHQFVTIWVIIDQSNNQLIGDCCFKDLPNEKGEIEIGYAIYPSYQKQGFMSEAISSISSWALQQNEVNAIIADTHKTNIASQRVLQKAGFLEIASCPNFIRWQLLQTQTAS